MNITWTAIARRFSSSRRGRRPASCTDSSIRPTSSVRWKTLWDSSRCRNSTRTAAAELSKGLALDVEDEANEELFNRVLWMTLKRPSRPMPAPTRMSQLELIRLR